MIGGVQVSACKMGQDVMASISEPNRVRMLHQRMQDGGHGGPTNIDKALGGNPTNLKFPIAKRFDETLYGATVADIPEAHCSLKSDPASLVLERLHQTRNRSRPLRYKGSSRTLTRDTIPVAELCHHAVQRRGTRDSLGTAGAAFSKEA